MSRDRLLLIITRWKNETYHLSSQLEQTKNIYQEKCFRLQQKLNKSKYENNSIANEDILKQLLINVDESSKISVLCDFFVSSLKLLLLSKLIEEKERPTRKFPPIIETIETNIKQIGNLINQMNENCSNELNKTF